jgi:hypothetical protein
VALAEGLPYLISFLSSPGHENYSDDQSLAIRLFLSLAVIGIAHAAVLPSFSVVSACSPIDSEKATGVTFRAASEATSSSLLPKTLPTIEFGDLFETIPTPKPLIILATPAGFEPATTRLEGECSIQLSYGVSNLEFYTRPDCLPQILQRDAVEAEIVGIALRLFGAALGRNYRVVEAVFLGESHRLLSGVKMQSNLVEGVGSARPPH